MVQQLSYSTVANLRSICPQMLQRALHERICLDYFCRIGANGYRHDGNAPLKLEGRIVGGWVDELK